MKKTIDVLYKSMPWNEIDTVVFDVGNVIISSGFTDVFKAFHFENEKLLYNLTYRSPYWVMLDSGSITLEEAIDAMTGWHENLRQDIDFLMHHWVEYKDVKNEGVDAVRICKEHGKHLIVLSNYSEQGFSYLENHFKVFELFDEIVVSSRIGMLKPCPDIYEYVQENCHIVPSRTLLVDDMPQNCVAAMNAGWHSLCANYQGVLKNFIR